MQSKTRQFFYNHSKIDPLDQVIYRGKEAFTNFVYKYVVVSPASLISLEPFSSSTCSKHLLRNGIKDYRAGAEIFHGDDECKKKIIELLDELCLPKGLFPLEDIEEFGYNRPSSFIWLIQKKKKDHTFKKIKRQVSYATEVTAFVEPRKLKKMTGVKTKELMLWLTVVEVYFEKPSSQELTFKTGTGLSDSFEASAFE